MYTLYTRIYTLSIYYYIKHLFLSHKNSNAGSSDEWLGDSLFYAVPENVSFFLYLVFHTVPEEPCGKVGSIFI